MANAVGMHRLMHGFLGPICRNPLLSLWIEEKVLFMGDNAARQPGTLQEVMLHETVVAWARNLMTKSTPAKPWEESPELFGRRLKEAFAFMNDNYNVEGLSRELPDRVQTLVEADGDRLCK